MSAPSLRLLSLTMLRVASMLVPRHQRAEWWNEWRAEAWHVRQACTSTQKSAWRAEREIAKFCMGAFQDAHCLRSQLPVRRIPLATTSGSAQHCLLLLAGLAVFASVVAMLIPQVRAGLQPSPYRDARHLVLLQDAKYKVGTSPTITAGQFATWIRHPQAIFDNLAFYQLRQEALRPNQATEEIAYASPELFRVLGVPVRFASGEDQARGLPRLILSDEL